MAYNTEKLAKLGQLKELAQKVREECATKASVNALSGRVDELVTAGGEPNVITGVQVNGTDLAVSGKKVNVTVPTKTSDLNNDSKYQTEEQVNAKLSSVYKPGGSVAFASLPAASAGNLGMVYNVTDAFSTTANFVDGAGSTHPAGTNVVVVSADGGYKYDVLAGFVDLTGYVQKEAGKALSANDYTDEEKAKLAGLENYVHQQYTAKASGLYKVTVDATGHVSATTSVTKSDITGLGIPGQDTTYSAATASASGLMKAADKAKLDSLEIATDAEVVEMLDEVFSATA